MTSIRINPDSPLPAMRQIVDALRVELVDGRLKPGDDLPSVRRAAIDLGLHFNTVAEAYRQLAEEGWLELRHGRSARVAHRAQPKATRHEVQNYRQRLRELVSQMRAAGISENSITEELLQITKGTKS
ncbi:MAG: GntR family transcriptional regulator [Pseudomonadota bacterium]